MLRISNRQKLINININKVQAASEGFTPRSKTKSVLPRC